MSPSMRLPISRYCAGAVDRSGKLIVPLEYDEVGEYSDGLAWAAKDGRSGFLGPKGVVAIPFIFDGAQPFRNGIAVVEQDGLFGAIDVPGRIVVPFA